MLSLAVRAAAAQEVTREFGYQPNTPEHSQTASLWLSAYHQGYTAPRLERFPLAGDQAFKRLLGAYLAENITVYHPHTGRYGRLMGLPACYQHDGEPFAEVEFYADAEAREEGCGDLTEPVGKLLPVLYGFEDLATEMLPHGTGMSPAFEIAIASLPKNTPKTAGFELLEKPSVTGRVIRVYFEVTGADWMSGQWLATINDWWQVELEHRAGIGSRYTSWPMANGVAIHQLLLSMHFAVGLAPHQYHPRQPGFDYASGAKPEAVAGKEASHAA